MRNNNFDFLRFYLAFIVFIIHFIILTDFESLTPFLSILFGQLAVNGFFVISGYLITISYKKSTSLKQYFVKRANRLLPAYIFLIVFVTISFSFISTNGITQYFCNPQTYKYFFFNIIFQNYLQPCLPGVFENSVTCAVDGSLWTLKIEVLFYLLLPVIIWVINVFSRKERYIIPIIIIYILSLLYGYLFNWLGEHYNQPIYTILGHQLPAYMSYFACGIAYAFYENKLLKKHFLFFLAIPILIIETIYKLEILTPLALSIIIFTVAYNFKWLNNFAKYGDISYGMYIYHFPIIQLGVLWGFYRDQNPYLSLIITFLVVVAIAFISWHYLEKRYIKKSLKRI